MYFAIISITIIRTSHNAHADTTVPELMVAAPLVTVFFSGIFGERCLSPLRRSEQGKHRHARVCPRSAGTLRNLDFASLSDSNFLAATPPVPAASPSPSPPQRRNLTTPANSSELAQNAIEEVTIQPGYGEKAAKAYSRWKLKRLPRKFRKTFSNSSFRATNRKRT